MHGDGYGRERRDAPERTGRSDPEPETPEEKATRCAQRVPEWLDLSGNPLDRHDPLDLSGCDLTAATLTYADLRGADLADVILSDANLEGANLYEANLTGTNLEDVHGCDRGPEPRLPGCVADGGLPGAW